MDINTLHTIVLELMKTVDEIRTKLDGAANTDQLSRINALRQAQLEDLQQRMETVETFIRLHSSAP